MRISFFLNFLSRSCFLELIWLNYKEIHISHGTETILIVVIVFLFVF